MHDFSNMMGSVAIAASSIPPIPSSGPIVALLFELIPGTAAGVVVAAVMNSLCCRVIAELGPPLPITKTLRTVLLTVQFFVSLS
jgi:hypothetical protein